jgi:hypothetical protein
VDEKGPERIQKNQERLTEKRPGKDKKAVKGAVIYQ